MGSTQYKVKCQYIITSELANVNDISLALGVEPAHSFNKGESYLVDDPFNKQEKTVAERPHTMWSVSSEVTMASYVGLSNHIEYFQLLFKNKLDALLQVKRKHSCGTLFWIWVEADKPLIGLTIDAKSLSFVNTIADDLQIQTAPIGTSKL